MFEAEQAVEKAGAMYCVVPLISQPLQKRAELVGKEASICETQESSVVVAARAWRCISGSRRTLADFCISSE